MRKIRIGKTFRVRWTILTNGEAQSLEGRNLMLELEHYKNGSIEIPFTISGNTVEAVIEGTQQTWLGAYCLTLWENHGTPNQTAVDRQGAFTLVSHTDEECDFTHRGIVIDEVVSLGTDTLSVGVKGDKGDPFTYADFTPEQLDDIKRPATDAAATATAAAQRANNAAETAETETDALRAERADIAYRNRDNGWAATQTFGDIVVANIIQQGESYEMHAQQVYTTQDIVYLREGAESALASGQYVGLVARLYNGEDDGLLIYDNEGARVGKAGDTEPLLTRAEKTDMVDGAPLVWDADGKRAVSGQWPQQPQWVYKEMEVTYEDDGSVEVFYVPTLSSDPNAVQ